MTSPQAPAPTTMPDLRLSNGRAIEEASRDRRRPERRKAVAHPRHERVARRVISTHHNDPVAAASSYEDLELRLPLASSRRTPRSFGGWDRALSRAALIVN